MEHRGNVASRFVESQHPRDNSGKFTVKGGGGGTFSYPANPETMKYKDSWQPKKNMTNEEFDDWEARIKADPDWWNYSRTSVLLGKHANQIVDACLTNSQNARENPISDQSAAHYAKAASDVFKQMTPKALHSFIKNVKNIQFHQSPEKLTKSVHGVEQKANGCVALGTWAHSDGYGTLHLDGDYQGSDARGTYAHEFGHVVDWIHLQDEGHGVRISSSGDWHVAFDSEIKNGRLSDYATVSKAEGFAEFARLAWTNPKLAYTKFPQCWAVFEKHGLVE